MPGRAESSGDMALIRGKVGDILQLYPQRL